MKKVNLKFTKVGNVTSPRKANMADAGIDFFVPDDFFDSPVTLTPGESVLIPSRIKAEVPKGWALVFFNKSGVATKKGLSVGACVVDSGYQGEIHLHLVNTSEFSTIIKNGEKIVQGLLIEVPEVILEEVDIDSIFTEETSRGQGGFGSSGTN